jgi:hypothetical protein
MDVVTIFFKKEEKKNKNKNNNKSHIPVFSPIFTHLYKREVEGGHKENKQIMVCSAARRKIKMVKKPPRH